MSVIQEINAIVKSAGNDNTISQIDGYPTAGKFVGKENSYSIGKNNPNSDGRFFTLPKGGARPSNANLYLRTKGKTKNFAVETPGTWSSDAIRSLADAVYAKGSPLLDTGGKRTVIGVPRDQFEREVESHDYLNSGEEHPFRYPIASMLGYVESLAKKEKHPFDITDMRKANGWIDQAVHGFNSAMSHGSQVFESAVVNSLSAILNNKIDMARSAGR